MDLTLTHHCGHQIAGNRGPNPEARDKDVGETIPTKQLLLPGGDSSKEYT